MEFNLDSQERLQSFSRPFLLLATLPGDIDKSYLKSAKQHVDGSCGDPGRVQLRRASETEGDRACIAVSRLISLDLVPQINEIFEYAARSKQQNDAEKKRRAVFIQRATEAEGDDNRRRIVVKEVLSELTGWSEGNDRGEERGQKGARDK